jgi:hypothetical protein
MSIISISGLSFAHIGINVDMDASVSGRSPQDFLRKCGALQVGGSSVFCRPDQFSRNSYVDDNGCLISE